MKEYSRLRVQLFLLIPTMFLFSVAEKGSQRKRQAATSVDQLGRGRVDVSRSTDEEGRRSASRDRQGPRKARRRREGLVHR